MSDWKDFVTIDVAIWILICIAWLVWEILGTMGVRDPFFTFTHMLRYLMTRHGIWKWVWRTLIFGAWLWLGWHLFLHNPYKTPGA